MAEHRTAEEVPGGMKSPGAAPPASPERGGGLGFPTEGHHVLHPSPWSSSSCLEPFCHLFYVQKARESLSTLFDRFWPALSLDEMAGEDELCASPGIAHMGVDIVPPYYGLCSTQGK